MADPLSIASGALAVITATQKTASMIYKFTRDCKEARTDLTQVTGELSQLTLILELIRDDNAAATEYCLPNALQAQVQAMLTSCATTVQQIENIIAKCHRRPGPLRWTILEKDKVTTLKGSLEAFKSGLSLVLETINLSIIREMNNKTNAIQDITLETKRDTSEILDEIYKLRDQLPPRYPSDQERLHLEQWLDSLTHYAESVVANEVPGELFDAASFLDDIGQGSDGDTGHPKNAEEQEASDDEVASQTSASITSDVELIDAGDAETPERRRGIPLASGKDRVESESGSGRPDSSRTESPKTRKPEVEKHTQNKRGPDEIPYHIIGSMPCSSKLVRLAYCMALDIWATLHKDLILRFWSPHKAELIVSLPVLRKHSGDPDVDTAKLMANDVVLIFCPAKPELILIQVRRSKLEAWNWNETRRIALAPDAQTSFLKYMSWVWFVPQSTLVYFYDDEDNLMIVDLDEPLIYQKVSLAILRRRAQVGSRLKIPGSNLAHLLPGRRARVGSELHKPRYDWIHFVSYCEICILWKGSIRRRGSSRDAASPYLTTLIRLPSTTLNLNRQRVSVATRYSDDVIKRARLTARYQPPRHIQSIQGDALDHETRRLCFITGRDKERDKGEHHSTTIYVLDLDTGTQLFESLIQGGYCLPRPFQYFFSKNSTTGVYSVIRMEDRSHLGTLPPWGFRLTRSGKAAFLRHMNSHVEFGITDVSLDQLGNSGK
ncbi:hypothetical protein F5B21DRAFT_484720 [Xylaria acuta]|nr:hypothetical protein F5B21DRAFT_484720 [Xylaria acuta]